MTDWINKRRREWYLHILRIDGESMMKAAEMRNGEEEKAWVGP